MLRKIRLRLILWLLTTSLLDIEANVNQVQPQDFPCFLLTLFEKQNEWTKKLSKIQFQNYLITNYFDIFEGIFLLCPKFQLAISSEKMVIIHYMFFLVESILLPSKCVNRQCVLCTINNFLLFLVFRSSCLVFSHSFSFLDNVFSLMYCREKSLVTCNQKIS